MSIVYDSLWRWREQFKAEEENNGASGHVHGKENVAPPSEGFRLRNPDSQAPVNGNELFDITFDFSDLNGMYTEDLSFDWFT